MVGSTKIPLIVASIILFAFLLSPILIVIPLSFSADQWLTFPPSAWSTRWYGEILGNAQIVDAFWTSLWLASIVTALTLLLSVPAVYALKRLTIAGEATLLNFFTSPLLLPSIVLGLGILIVFAPANLLGTYTGLTLAHLVVTVPYAIRILATTFDTLNANIEEAAASLGANPVKVFALVTLPMLMPGLIAAGVLSFLSSFDEVVISLFLVGPRINTLPVALFSYVESHSDPMGAAVSSLLIFLTLIVVVALERLMGLTRALGKQS